MRLAVQELLGGSPPADAAAQGAQRVVEEGAVGVGEVRGVVGAGEEELGLVDAVGVVRVDASTVRMPACRRARAAA